MVQNILEGTRERGNYGNKQFWANTERGGHYVSIVSYVVVEVPIFFSLKKYYKTTILCILTLLFSFTIIIFKNMLKPFDALLLHERASKNVNQIACFLLHLINTYMCRNVGKIEGTVSLNNLNYSDLFLFQLLMQASWEDFILSVYPGNVFKSNHKHFYDGIPSVSRLFS